ncbi:Protein lifeguard 2 [Merluccius polli]|uniref:Protein lifeguard 2 n=1 Tax=Merluccius polli TaxID=89951 RepID=A0AA47MTT7_MERPO|nr:Protein lifeguard 2 [Merluccius polli]
MWPTVCPGVNRALKCMRPTDTVSLWERGLCSVAGFSERAITLPSVLFAIYMSLRPKRRQRKITPQKDAVATRVADQSGSAMAGWVGGASDVDDRGRARARGCAGSRGVGEDSTRLGEMTLGCGAFPTLRARVDDVDDDHDDDDDDDCCLTGGPCRRRRVATTMSKADAPPGYEEAISTPKYEAYGVGPHPPAPPPAYSPGPCPYPGQPSYSHPQAGFPPAGMPHTIIPTLSAAVSTHSLGDMEDFSDQWESTSVRHAFIRKVYLILAAQLSFTVGIVAVFTFVDPVRHFVIQYPCVYWASFYHDTKSVFLAIGITMIVCLAVTIFCFQTKVDFTSCGGLLCTLGVLLTIIGIITSVVLSFQYIPWLHMVYAAIGAVIYTLFLAYNTQLLIGNRAMAISPEEYVYGALSLYVDIVQVFLFVLEIGGAAMD